MHTRKLKGLLLSGAVAVVSGVGCTSVLGDYKTDPATQLDGSILLDGSTQQSEASVDPGADAGPTIFGCAVAIDCPALAIPCATAACVESKCVYTAIDFDGDGHQGAGCKGPDGLVIAGDDCADTDPAVFPGASCDKDSAGNKISFPKGSAIGACKFGTISCAAGTPKCDGAVGPAKVDDCNTPKIDENCDGVLNDGCACVTGTVEACGNIDNSPLPCKAGTRTCLGSQWGACTGNVEKGAINCTSGVDNNCNGTADNAEAACTCSGAVIGSTMGCTAPAPAEGVCASGGTRTCTTTPDNTSAVYTACAPGKPQARNCASSQDNDCANGRDDLEAGCGSPCHSGTKVVAAIQKFSDNIYGCGGTIAYANRTAVCNPTLIKSGAHVVTAAEWNTYDSSLVRHAVPTHQYWVADAMNYGGTQTACSAGVKAPNACATDAPMHVCIEGKAGASTVDQDGNTCTWTGCGAYPSTDGVHFGGCAGTTAGVLCYQP